MLKVSAASEMSEVEIGWPSPTSTNLIIIIRSFRDNVLLFLTNPASSLGDMTFIMHNECGIETDIYSATLGRGSLAIVSECHHLRHCRTALVSQWIADIKSRYGILLAFAMPLTDSGIRPRPGHPQRTHTSRKDVFR